MLEGKIITILSNIYTVEVDGVIYECNARGKFKNKDISPVVGDNVIIEITEKESKKAIINEILPRKKYIKRPKMANLDKLILVLSAKFPKPDLLMLDKELVYAEYLGIDVIIVINKTDLEKEETVEEIQKIYTDIRI